MTNRVHESFTIITNGVVNNMSLSLEAKGFYAFLCAKPPKWNFSNSGLLSQLLISKFKLRKLIKELVTAELLIRKSKRDLYGKFVGWNWILNPTKEDIIKNTDPCSRSVENVDIGKNATSENADMISNKDNVSNLFENDFIKKEEKSFFITKVKVN